MAFVTVNFAEIMCAVNMRSQHGSIFDKTLIKNFNWWLFGAVAVSVGLTLCAVYLPGLSDIFGVTEGTFGFNELLCCITLSVSTIPVFELGKAMRKLNKRENVHAD